MPKRAAKKQKQEAVAAVAVADEEHAERRRYLEDLIQTAATANAHLNLYFEDLISIRDSFGISEEFKDGRVVKHLGGLHNVLIVCRVRGENIVSACQKALGILDRKKKDEQAFLKASEEVEAAVKAYNAANADFMGDVAAFAATLAERVMAASPTKRVTLSQARVIWILSRNPLVGRRILLHALDQQPHYIPESSVRDRLTRLYGAADLATLMPGPAAFARRELGLRRPRAF